MQISHWTVVALFVIVLLNTLFIGALAVFLWAISKKVDEGLEKVTPLLQKAGETLTQVEATTTQLQQRMDKVLTKTTELVDRVTERVDTTTAIAEEAVTEPLIGAASLMAGIQRGLRVYTEKSHEKGDGTS